MPKMLEDPLDEPDRVEPLPVDMPVTTRSPGCKPEMICVFTPSLIPVWTVTGVTVPLRMTVTLPLAEIAAFGTSTTFSAD